MYFSKLTGGFYATQIHGDSIPADAVEITAEEHAALLAGQSSGKVITADAEGRPCLAEPAPLTPNQITLGKIAELEASVTDRRIREAVLGIDNGWLANVNAQIDALRNNLS
jgi:hypothetical protein